MYRGLRKRANRNVATFQPTLYHRRLRCEPLEQRRVLSTGPLHVDADSTAPNHDGLAWATAYADLQDALDRANELNTDLDAENDVSAIWIAEGTYKPSALLEIGDARSASFSLLDGVSLHGGFAGTEDTLDARDWSAHVTTLSGDLGTPDDNSDNAYTVAYCGRNIEAAIDGVSITDGNANGGNSDRSRGGGIYNDGTLTVTNSILSGNSAEYGGGIYNDYGPLTVTNSTLSGNSATGPYVGGNGGGRPRLSQKIASGLTDDGAQVMVEDIVRYYKENAQPRERLGRMIDRIGLETLTQAVLHK